MHIGHYISGAAHTGLIGWVLLGGVFSSDPPPMEVTDVSVISAADFEALLQAQAAPDAATELALPNPPEEVPVAPDLVSEPDVTPEQVTPAETEPVVPDTVPETVEVAPPVPVTPQDVAQETPQLPTPEVESAVVIPDTPVRPVTRPADRVAPEPVAPPEPDVAIADVVQEATTPDEAGPATEEAQEETAPEAASAEIATEPKQDEVASAAPSRSLRPRLRPTQVTPTPSPAATEDAIAAALAEANAATTQTSETPRGPSGPPLTRGEKDGLRVAVQQCWIVDVGSRAADVTVVVGVSLDQDGKVQSDVRLLSAQGGDDTAVQTAFQSARRAVLRCQKTGYDLPVEKYDHWRDVEITFNPENMRRR